MDKKLKNMLSIASGLYKKGKYQDVIDVYKKLESFYPKLYDVHFNLSVCYFNIKDFDNSIKYALSASEINSDDIDLARHISNLYKLNKENINLLEKFQELADKHNDVNLLYHCAILLNESGNTNNSLYFLQKILEIDSENLQAMKSIATIYSDLDKEVSLQMYEELAAKHPKDIDIKYCLLELYLATYKDEKTIEQAKELLRINKDINIYYALTQALENVYNYQECEKYLEEALELYPDDAQIRTFLTFIYQTNNKKDKAESIIKPYKHLPEFKKTYARYKLANREIEDARDGFFLIANKFDVDIETIEDKAKDVFHRFNFKKQYNISEQTFLSFGKNNSNEVEDIHKYYQKKMLDSVDCSGKNILLYTPNGAGDIIFSLRYLPFLIEKANTVILVSQKPLNSLIKYNFPTIKIEDYPKLVDESLYDYSSSDLNIINLLNINFKDIPFSSGFLKVSPELIKEKSSQVEFPKDKLKIGIYWQGNPTILKNRSTKLNKLLPLFNSDKRKIYSFQMSKIDYESDNLKKTLDLVDLAPYIKNYEDTAAFLHNIDVLVTIDTSIAHLAGALGIKTFLMLPYASEWRWFDDTDTTPWYDSVKIFKQDSDCCWDSVISRINEELNNVKL